MSARNEMAAMLDQLMGPRRNADAGCNALVRFDDPEVCPLALVAYCPHDAFNNTKYELQPCKKIHEPKLREDYEKSSRRYKLGYEQEALAYFLGLQRDLHRRIDANKAKLKLERGDGALDEARGALRNKLSCVETEIEGTQAAAEKAGAAGDIEKSVALVQQAEAMQAQRDELRRQMDIAASQPRTFKAMEVCEVCGCLLIVNDAACRVEDHLTGKVHMGYIHIDQAAKELKETVAKECSGGDRESRPRDRDRRDDRDRERRGDRSDRRDDRERSSRPRHHRERSRSDDRRRRR